MNILQSFRRLGQKMTGWNDAIDTQSHQLTIITKLFTKNGLELKRTSFACPEQYDVFRDSVKVGYLILRHGEFRVDYPECGGETIFEAQPNGDGIFDDKERLVFMNLALKAIIKKINTNAQ